MDAARQSRPAISVVVPAYNESAGIRAALVAYSLALETHFPVHEILVVDDGSTDGTHAEVLAAAIPTVRLISHRRNKGYGAALRTGFEAAQFPLVAFTDADAQFDLADLATLADHAAPIAVGIRTPRRDPALRCFLARGYNVLTRALLGTRVTDCDCALKVFRREVLPDLLPRTRGFLVNAEMLTSARQAGHAVSEWPVKHFPRRAGQSSVGWREVPRTARGLLMLWWTDVVWGPRPRRHTVMRQVFTTRVIPAPAGPQPLLRSGSESVRPVERPVPRPARA